jgi:hypothetical protein
MSDASQSGNGRFGALGPSLPDEVEQHLSEAARAIRDAPAPIGPELLTAALTGFAEVFRQIVERREEAPAAAPFLFGSPVVSEAAQMWQSRIREATRDIPYHQLDVEQADEPS